MVIKGGDEQGGTMSNEQDCVMSNEGQVTVRPKIKDDSE